MSWFSKKKTEAKTEDGSTGKPKKQETKKGWFDDINLSNIFDDEEKTNDENEKKQNPSTGTQDNINPTMRQPPINTRIENANKSEDNNTNKDNALSDTSTDMEEDGLDKLDSVDTNTEDTVSDVFKDEETEEEPKETKKILKRSDEEKTKEYIKETLGRIINGENLLENMQTFMDFIRIIPDNNYEENIENYAIVLANATINGEKIFKDTEDAKQFIDKVRNGVKTAKRYIKPRAQKQIKQEMQKETKISPMMLRNVKARTQAINVFQY